MTDTRLPQEPELHFELISDWHALEKLTPDWRELLYGNCRHPTMLDPDWSMTWWQYYSAGRCLRVGTFRNEGRLVGLMPMCARTYRYRLGLPFRRLEFIGAGFDESDGVCSDYLGPIVTAGYEAAVSAAFVQCLIHDAFGAFDECLLEMMESEHPMAAPLRSDFLKCGMKFEEEVVAVAPFTTLPDRWETFEMLLRKKQRHAIRSVMRGFERWASSEDVRVQRAEDAATLALGFDILSDLHAERWHSANAQGVFASPRFSNFHRDYMKKALSKGQLELLWLTVNGEPVAATYSILGLKTVYFYQSGRSMRVPPQVRIGLVMLILTFQEAIKKGFSEFDFLGGDVHYKRLFARQSRQLIRQRLARRTAKERVRVLTKNAGQVVRKSLAYVQRGKLLAAKRGAVSDDTISRD